MKYSIDITKLDSALAHRQSPLNCSFWGEKM